MAIRRMGLELVFNLQWKNEEDGGEKANVMGMYDTPTTTQNFETFKSYLLKNSGVAANDVKVTYITDNDGEWVIDNQYCFEIALCTFRLKSRLGEIIFLKLDKISEAKSNKMSVKPITTPTEPETSSLSNEPPQWFLEYMSKFKKDLADEVTTSVTNIVLNNNKTTPEVVVNQPVKKHKVEGSRRLRRHPHHAEVVMEKDLIKNLKFERRLDSKLDKLEGKIKKTLEKKKGCIMKQMGTLLKPEETEQVDDALLMNATLVNETSMKPHMLGGERYLHTWEVINVGKLQWTNDVKLCLTWGSIDMKPAVKNIPVPKLKPGEIGYISVLFQIPKTPGQYESYWNFYDKDTRFGQSLSFCVIVDPPSNCFDDIFSSRKIDHIDSTTCKEEAAKSCPSTILNTAFEQEIQQQQQQQHVTEEQDVKVEMKPDLIDYCSDSDNESVVSTDENSDVKKTDDFVLVQVPTDNGYRLTEEDEEELAVDLCKNLSLEGVMENNVTVEANNNQQNDNNNNKKSNNTSSESICKIDSGTPSSEASYNMIALSGDENDDENDYVYIEVKGQKVMVPKKILHPDYVNEKTSKKPTPESVEVVEKPVETEKSTNNNNPNMESYLSHCSAAGACLAQTLNNSDKGAQDNSSRLFIFPYNNPGYEVVKPEAKVFENTSNSECGQLPRVTICPTNQADETFECLPTYTWAESETKYTTADVKTLSERIFRRPLPAQSTTPTFTHVPNYQQTPKAEQDAPIYESLPNENVFNGIYQRQNSSPPPPTPPKTNETNKGQQNVRPSSASTSDSTPIQILPENLVNGAVNVASSAINTARSVINMLTPPRSEPGNWVNGHWVTINPESKRAKNLKVLNEMGFWDLDLNATLLARYNDDLNRVITELLQ